MKLKKLILHNYKQHIDREQVFEGHFIGVVGRNGAGKSNLLGSLNFAMGGEQPGFKKQDLLRWGADEGHVILDFEHNGVAGRIYRELHSARAEFKYGNESYTTATAVAAGIAEHLGLDKDILKQTIFVRQAEIDSILFEDPRIRQLAFQKLCGIGDAAKIHKKLGDELSALSVPPDYGVQIAEGKQRYEEMSARINTLRTTLTGAQAQRATCPATAALQTQLGAYIAMRGTVARAAAVESDTMAYHTRLSNAQAALATMVVPTGDVNAIDVKLSEHRVLLARAQEYMRNRMAWENAGKALIALGDPPVPVALPYTEEQVAALYATLMQENGAYAKLTADIKMYTDLKATLGGLVAVECPVCGADMKDATHVHKMLAELQPQLEQCKVRLGRASHAHTEAAHLLKVAITSNASAAQTYAGKREMLERAFAQALTAFKAVQTVDQSPETVMAEIANLEAMRQKVMQVMTEHSRLQNEVKLCNEQLAKLAAEAGTLEQTLAGIPEVIEARRTGGYLGASQVLEQRLAQLSAQIAELQQLDQQLAQLSGMVNELATNMVQLEKTLATLEGKRDSQGKYREVLDTITRVRDWFHYNNGPNTLANAVLNSMNTDINEFLGQFTAPFSVVQSEDSLGFKCYFHDGRDMPSDGPPDAYHLSGGQRIQLAIAFRFASYCMFANKLGLLSLDEPTVHLDEYNVGAFCTLISKIREVAQKMDLQVLIATHEPSVIPFMDTVIEVGE